ncbi:MAG: hypothetical protein M1821_008171 [Bathelium mastoideum]|nr:MAG: hypothetical protein M1821_008171 [Bathelium mastoideum]
MATQERPYPSGGTFLDTLTRSFKDVPVDANNDKAVGTTEFLEAADSLTTLFDVLGSVAFKPVQSDMHGNIKKVRDLQSSAPDQCKTIQSAVTYELKTLKKKNASEGLMWLLRGLDFTSQALRQNLSNASEELSTSFRTAYSTTLKQHHSLLIKPIFSAAMSATPYRRDFYAKLGDQGDQERVRRELSEWVGALEGQVGILQAFLARKEVLGKS